MASGMSRRSVVRGLVGGAVALVGIKVTGTLAAPQVKKTICHSTSSAVIPGRQITQPLQYLNAHLAHGDFYVTGNSQVACCCSQDCPQPANSCMESVCNVTNTGNGKDGLGGVSTCSAPQPEAQGTLCDDLDLCTVNDVCDGDGTCAGTAVDCSELDGVCQAGVCNPTSGACETNYLAHLRRWRRLHRERRLRRCGQLCRHGCRLQRARRRMPSGRL